MKPKPKPKEEPELRYEDINATELRQILLIQLGVRISRRVSQAELVQILETSEYLPGQLDPIEHDRQQLQGWLEENWEHYSNQLRCSGKCTETCTDAQVMACTIENLAKVQ